MRPVKIARFVCRLSISAGRRSDQLLIPAPQFLQYGVFGVLSRVHEVITHFNFISFRFC